MSAKNPYSLLQKAFSPCQCHCPAERNQSPKSVPVHKKELFFTDVEGKTKDEVLKNLCRKVEQEKGLPETFTASVLKREELTPTDYGNLVALPHPERAFQERAFVAVAVLKEPIFWFRQKVQVVFLTAIGREEDENLQQFYEATTDLILRPADVKNLIRHPDYDRLIQLLRRAEE